MEVQGCPALNTFTWKHYKDVIFPPVSGQTNPNTSGKQAQEKDKGRHVQTWDSGMMGDFI